MPIISNFPTGSGNGGSGLALGAVSNISTVVSHGKVYFKWTDPDDIIVSESTLAAFAGTILVRKAGSAPVSRRDGTVVLDSKTRNAYQDIYFCDSGLTDGVTYYYKFFTYTTQNIYTDLEDNLVEITPVAVDTALNDISWEDIGRISDAGLASSYFAVGDRKAVALSGTVGSLSLSDTYYCYIIGIDHNSGKEGINRIHFQFGYSALSGGVHLAFIDSYYAMTQSSGSWFNMNNSASNSGGWNSSLMRTSICPAFKNAMPSDLQAVLKTVTKYSDNTGGGSNTASYVTATTDNVFLLAEYEVFGSRHYANSAEKNYQAQYAWYSAGNSKVRYRHSATSSTAIWWLRSVSVVISNSFCFVSDSGSANYNVANGSDGFAPAFCV